MKVKDIIKKQTTVIAIAIVLVAITIIGISYAIFFDVKTNSNNQVITAGTLKLTISGISEENTLALSEPMSSSAGLSSTPVSYTVQNTDSNLPATYSIYIYADNTNTMDLSKIKISLDGDATSGTTSQLLSSITDTFTEDGQTYFKINSGELDAGASGTTNYIRVWVDEDLLTEEITNVTVSLNMYIISEVNEAGA